MIIKDHHHEDKEEEKETFFLMFPRQRSLDNGWPHFLIVGLMSYIQ